MANSLIFRRWIQYVELLFGKKALEQAKKSAWVYMCVACQSLTGERWIWAIWPMQDNVLKTHVSRDREPYYCLLCICLNVRQSSTTQGIVTMLGYRAITSQEEWQTESPVPYKIREDLHKSPRKTASYSSWRNSHWKQRPCRVQLGRWSQLCLLIQRLS